MHFARIRSNCRKIRIQIDLTVRPYAVIIYTQYICTITVLLYVPNYKRRIYA